MRKMKSKKKIRFAENEETLPKQKSKKGKIRKPETRQKLNQEYDEDNYPENNIFNKHNKHKKHHKRNNSKNDCDDCTYNCDNEESFGNINQIEPLDSFNGGSYENFASFNH